MEKTVGDVTVLQAENVPETAEAEQVMQNMIDKGAKLIFATSYGHLEFAQNVAEKNPDVTFVHQGGLEGKRKMDNVGTYFGTVYEPVYLAGIAAGAATKTNKLGYIYAFPIQQAIVALSPGISPLGLLTASTVATLLAAALSWHLLERHVLERRGACVSQARHAFQRAVGQWGRLGASDDLGGRG